MQTEAPARFGWQSAGPELRQTRKAHFKVLKPFTSLIAQSKTVHEWAYSIQKMTAD